MKTNKSYRWAKVEPPQSKSLRRKFTINYSALALYDSSLVYDSRIAFTEEHMAARAYKRPKAVTLIFVERPV